jgi:hypothetical protein
MNESLIGSALLLKEEHQHNHTHEIIQHDHNDDHHGDEQSSEQMGNCIINLTRQ